MAKTDGPKTERTKTWNAEAVRDLTIAVLMSNFENGKIRYNWPETHAIMCQLGYSFTKDAISQHFTKTVMKDFKARNGDVALDAKTPTPTKAAKRKASGDEEGTPTKKAKREAEVKDDSGTETKFKPVNKRAAPSKKAKKETS